MRVVDIGANIGYYTLQLARLVGDNGKVFAIEPVPDTAKLLRKNLDANGYHNVSVHEVALGAEAGKLKLYLSHQSEWASFKSKELPDTYIDVPLYTLDTLFGQEGRIDYIKMDIEGYEIEAIKGMRSILKKYSPGIFVEIHPSIVGKDAILKFLDELKELGYEDKYVVDRISDHAWVKRKHKTETIKIDDLKMDKRVVGIESGLVLFLKNIKQAV